MAATTRRLTHQRSASKSLRLQSYEFDAEIGRWTVKDFNEKFDLSGQASDYGIQVKETYLASGLSEGVADVAGGLATIFAGAGAGAAYVIIPPIPFLDDD